MLTSTFAIFLVCITLPVIILLYVTESQHTKVQRLYKTGRYSQQQLAERFGVSRSTIRRRLAVA